jgi:hypothetical protein
MIRMWIYPDYFSKEPEWGQMSLGHVNHCIDQIRASLMCSSDLSAIVWTWSREKEMYTPRADIIHQCRDFDSIYEWGSQHALGFDIHPSLHH